MIKNGKDQRDILALRGESVDGEEQLVDVYINGELVYDLPELEVIRRRAKDSISALPESCKKIEGQERYRVEISKGIDALIKTLL